MDRDDGRTGRIKQKLVESKERWAREGRLLTAARAALDTP